MAKMNFSLFLRFKAERKNKYTRGKKVLFMGNKESEMARVSCFSVDHDATGLG
jgi:hypothetical protein